jgi:hypothetical protein
LSLGVRADVRHNDPGKSFIEDERRNAVDFAGPGVIHCRVVTNQDQIVKVSGKERRQDFVRRTTTQEAPYLDRPTLLYTFCRLGGTQNRFLYHNFRTPWNPFSL